MSEVMKKAAELAAAIASSPELASLRDAEIRVSMDAEATEMLEEVARLQHLARISNDPRAGEALEEALKKFSENENFKAFLEANEAINRMLEKINAMLVEAIQGRPHGMCEGCSGCGF